MNFISSLKHQLKTLIIGYRFMQVVEAPYGAFSKIGKYADVLMDQQGMQLLIEYLSCTSEGKQALVERRYLGKVDLDALYQLPPNTLGHLYAAHMKQNGLVPPPVREPAPNDYVYLFNYISETHDIWHIVTGSDTTKAGELQIETFSLAQFYPARFWIALLAKNFLKTALFEIELCEELMAAVVRGWIMGRRAKPLFGIPWQEHWETPIDQIRAELNIDSVLSADMEAVLTKSATNAPASSAFEANDSLSVVTLVS
ncbi:hypothetical protein H6F90_19840 [Trichocoleus sp. FACHB-591]|uniref:Coq4 family protein n=1 Tax=Trichocoleus sp. FACHB-591 TaxID=2692872 RepID=UPI001686D1C3|nr:Coq4 family protein [Trichocoleus sp. FACHB-591]MBD2097355.1 hypothetical protein [Trichocoleus sp. FACHB-591]